MIHIIDDWYLDSEDNGKCVTVKRDTGRLDKDKNTVYSEHFYPPTIEKGIERLCSIYQNKAMNDQQLELREYLNVCQEIKEDFKKVLNNLKEEAELDA